MASWGGGSASRLWGPDGECGVKNIQRGWFAAQRRSWPVLVVREGFPEVLVMEGRVRVAASL